MSKGQHRQLAAILFTDMAGYTAIMAEDEVHAARLRDRHRKVLDQYHQQFHGEILQYFGDGTLSLFPSSKEAVQCAISIQHAMLEEPHVPLRIGIHSGEIVRDHDGIYGNTVNIASRLESLATIGSILISARVRDELANQPNFLFQSLGLFSLKNVPKPMEVFAVANPGIVVPRGKKLKGKGKLLEDPDIKWKSRLEHFVGREEELSRLRKIWMDVKQGKGVIFGIAGDPGLGKSTLAEDFLQEISESNHSRRYCSLPIC